MSAQHKTHARVDLQDNTTTIVAAGTRVKLHKVYVETVLSAAACPITDGRGGAFASLVASLAAGSMLDFGGVELDGLIVNPDDAATGLIVVIYERA